MIGSTLQHQARQAQFGIGASIHVPAHPSIPASFQRFTIAIARAHRRGDERRVNRLLVAKMRAVRRFHGFAGSGA
jgi:hypothetical protein